MTLPSVARSLMARNTVHGTPRSSQASAIAAVSMSSDTTPFARSAGSSDAVGDHVGGPHGAADLARAEQLVAVLAAGGVVDHPLGQHDLADRGLVVDRARDADDHDLAGGDGPEQPGHAGGSQLRCPCR